MKYPAGFLMCQMLMRRCLVMMVILMASTWAGAQSSKVIEKVKLATAYIVVAANDSEGTAFCISKKGHFITCAHVLGRVGVGEEVKLVLQPGTSSEKEIKARVVRKDDAMDLAVLTAEKTPETLLHPLSIALSSQLKETQPVVVAGFPLGGYLARGNKNPAVTIGTGKVTAIRNLVGTVDRVQIDAKLNPGNSGGPVIDHDGALVGIAVSKIVGYSSLNFAIATEKLHLIMQAATITASEIDPISFEDRKKELVVPFTLSYLVESKSPPVVEAYIEGSVSGKRQIKVEKDGEGYLAIGVPMPSNVKGASSILQANFMRVGSKYRHTITMDVYDQVIKVGDKKVRLSALSMLFPLEKVARDHVGKDIRGAITGLEKVQEVNENRPSVVNMSSWQCIAFRPLRSVTEDVTLILVVKDKAATSTHRIFLPLVRGAENLVNIGTARNEPFDPAAGKELLLSDSKKVISLDGIVKDVAWGAGGRYLIIHIIGKKELVVVDCAKGEIEGKIPFEGEDVTFSAGAEYILLAQGNSVSHWSYSPLHKVNDFKVWVPGQIHQLAVGAGANHLLGVFYDALPPRGIYRFEFRDLLTGRLVAIEPRQTKLEKGMHFRSSISGHAYGAFQDAISSSGDSSVFYANQNLMAKTEFSNTGWLCPDPLGKHCYTAWKGAQMIGYTSSHSRASTRQQSLLTMSPTTVSGIVNRVALKSSGDELVTPYWSIFDAKKNDFLIKNALVLDEFDTAKLEFKFEQQSKDPLTWDKRLFYNPQLGLLVTIPLTNNSVIIRKYDLWKQLEKNQEEYLYPVSFAPTVLSENKAFSFQMVMKSSSQKPLTYELIEGPVGLEISSEGLLQWQASSDDAGKDHNILLKVSSQDGHFYLWQHQLFVH